jgi:heme A synthase
VSETRSSEEAERDSPRGRRREVWGARLAAGGVVIFVATAVIAAYRAGWPKDELGVPRWAIPLVAVAWALIIIGSIMARTQRNDDDA